MLNRPCLLVFIDGLPSAHMDILADSGEWSSRKSVTPGLGFSVNIKAEMFAGMSPDMAGYFNEWSYTHKGRYRRLQSIFWISGLASQIYSLNRAIHQSAWGKWSEVLTRNPDAVQIGLTSTSMEFEYTKNSSTSLEDKKSQRTT